jgi:hypothetical protein
MSTAILLGRRNPPVAAHSAMPPSFKALPQRAAEKARETAAGTPVPAGQETPAPGAAGRPGARERAAMRRRVRKVARTREALVRELGVLVVEMERLGRRNDELLRRKAREITTLDEELRGLREALGQRRTIEQVVATGIAGECSKCGSLLGTEDCFCSRCGTPAGGEPAAAAEPQPSPSQLQLQTVGAERT